ncbi:MAG TPA: butyrate kinase, partial [Rectinemataceae bacterium]
MAYCVLVVNPGSTSTKLAVFEGDKRLFDRSLSHSAEDLAGFKTIASQYEFRRKALMKALEEENF